MPIDVDWTASPWVITIPQSELTLVTGTQYRITVDYLFELCREFSATEEGMMQVATYRNTPPTSSTPRILEFNNPYYECQFENGSYSVDIEDGNTNWRDVEIKNTVSVGTNNTAAFINPTFLEAGLFNNQVCVDSQNVTGAAVAGTGKTPNGDIIGTRAAPSDNMTDALAIAAERVLNEFNLMSNLTLTGGDYSSGYRWTADRRPILLTVESAANVQNNSMFDMTVAGELDGLNSVERCDIEAVTNISGQVFQCQIQSTVGVTGDTSFTQCTSGVAGAGYPLINNVGTSEVIVRDMRGSIGLADITGGAHSIGVYGGRVIVEATCTGGTIHVRGDPYEITDASAGATVVNQIDSEKQNDVHQTALNKREWDKINNKLYVYDDDKVTILHEFDTNDDLSSIDPV